MNYCSYDWIIRLKKDVDRLWLPLLFKIWFQFQHESLYKNKNIPDRSFFFFIVPFEPFLSFFVSLADTSWTSESEPSKDATSDFLFLWCWGSWLWSFSDFLFFLTSCCSVCSSEGCRLCSVKLCFCFSFAFCCSLASNARDRDSFETLPSSSSPRYLWVTRRNTHWG